MEEKNEKEIGEERYYGVGSFVIEIVKVVILAFVIIVPIRVFLFQPFFVQGSSMEPNFKDGEYLIINELGYKETDLGFFEIKPFKEIPRQEPVVFHYPQDPKKFFIKRVIGLPGEKIEIKNGKINVYNSENPNGMSLDEIGYISNAVKTAGDITLKLKDDEYFVMGDNRMYSSDSRMWGPVSEKYIMGTVLIRAWPFNRVKIY